MRLELLNVAFSSVTAARLHPRALSAMSEDSMQQPLTQAANQKHF
jgi:hypothetical protein